MSQQSRKDPRAKVLSMTVRYKSATLADFIEHHSHDVSRGGMFIKTPQPFPPGTLLKFEVRIAGDEKVIQGVGRVVWKRETAGPDPDKPVGMGIKFIKLDDGSRRVIEQLMEHRSDEPSAFDRGNDEFSDSGWDASTESDESRPSAPKTPVTITVGSVAAKSPAEPVAAPAAVGSKVNGSSAVVPAPSSSAGNATETAPEARVSPPVAQRTADLTPATSLVPKTTEKPADKRAVSPAPPPPAGHSPVGSGQSLSPRPIAGRTQSSLPVSPPRISASPTAPLPRAGSTLSVPAGRPSAGTSASAGSAPTSPGSSGASTTALPSSAAPVVSAGGAGLTPGSLFEDDGNLDDRTVMRQTTELLQEALRGVGGSSDNLPSESRVLTEADASRGARSGGSLDGSPDAAAPAPTKRVSRDPDSASFEQPTTLWSARSMSSHPGEPPAAAAERAAARETPEPRPATAEPQSKARPVPARQAPIEPPILPKRSSSRGPVMLLFVLLVGGGVYFYTRQQSAPLLSPPAPVPTLAASAAVEAPMVPPAAAELQPSASATPTASPDAGVVPEAASAAAAGDVAPGASAAASATEPATPPAAGTPAESTPASRPGRVGRRHRPEVESSAGAEPGAPPATEPAPAAEPKPATEPKPAAEPKPADPAPKPADPPPAPPPPPVAPGDSLS